MFIKGILKKLENLDENLQIKVSDGTYLTKEFGSDRGDYYDMYIGYTYDVDDYNIIKNVKELKDLIKESLKIGTMTGYKGGEFEIDEYTNVTIGMYGCSGNYISDIRLKDDIVYVVYERLQEVWG